MGLSLAEEKAQPPDTEATYLHLIVGTEPHERSHSAYNSALQTGGLAAAQVPFELFANRKRGIEEKRMKKMVAVNQTTFMLHNDDGDVGDESKFRATRNRPELQTTFQML